MPVHLYPVPRSFVNKCRLRADNGTMHFELATAALRPEDWHKLGGEPDM